MLRGLGVICLVCFLTACQIQEEKNGVKTLDKTETSTINEEAIEIQPLVKPTERTKEIHGVGGSHGNDTLDAEILEGYFNETVFLMEQMIDSLSVQEVEQAISTFHQAHDFFHDIDPSLREASPKLAEDLWNAIGLIEWEIDKKYRKEEDLINYTNKALTFLYEAQKEMIKKTLP